MEYPLCEMPKEEFEKHGCGYWRIVDGKRVCAGSPCAEFFRKRLAAVEAERDEMRKQMLEELGRADILEKRVGDLEKLLDAVHTDLKDVVEGSGDALHGALATLLAEVIEKCEVKP